MIRKYNKYLIPVAKKLRRDMTKEERHLWYDFLRTHPARFTRQKVLGRFIADFYSARLQLVIEVDGAQHYDSQGLIYDEERTAILESMNLRVIRISNYDINHNFENACSYIESIIKEQTTIHDK